MQLLALHCIAWCWKLGSMEIYLITVLCCRCAVTYGFVKLPRYLTR